MKDEDFIEQRRRIMMNGIEEAAGEEDGDENENDKGQEPDYEKNESTVE